MISLAGERKIPLPAFQPAYVAQFGLGAIAEIIIQYARAELGGASGNVTVDFNLEGEGVETLMVKVQVRPPASR